MTDAIGGQIDGVCDSAASVSQAIDDKLVKGLVVGSTVRLATLPDLPTSAEAGLPDFEAQGWNGLFARKGTPARDHRETERRGQNRRRERGREEALSRSLHRRARRQRARARSARAVGDARRREIQKRAEKGRRNNAARAQMKKPSDFRADMQIIAAGGVEVCRCRAGACRVNVDRLGED
jgi:hypothetical protein